jgi:hypothetical protein
MTLSFAVGAELADAQAAPVSELFTLHPRMSLPKMALNDEMRRWIDCKIFQNVKVEKFFP